MVLQVLGKQSLQLTDNAAKILGLVNVAGKTVAEITYDNWVEQGQCRQPLDINIAGLDYGTNITIKLSNVLISSEAKTYRLKPPHGYLRQYMR